MPALMLAAVTSDNVRGGYLWTFLFPMLLFIIAGAVLYLLLFSRPHARVPARRIQPARGGVPEMGAARAAAVTGGLSVAPGGGTAESPAEPHGAPLGALGAAGKVAEPERGGAAGPDGGSNEAGAGGRDEEVGHDPGGRASASTEAGGTETGNAAPGSTAPGTTGAGTTDGGSTEGE